MSDVHWSIQGREFVQCNCAYGCPCQFNALPTHGNCEATVTVQIDKGHHGDVKLDGLRCAVIARWPGAIHEGNGEVVPIVDERANEAQREALLRIMTGQDTDPGATMFQVFSTTFSKVHDPVFAPIEFDLDVDGRTANVRVPGLIEAHGEPLMNPVSGQPHRARIDLPEGFEYDVCEVGRGWGETQDPLKLSISDAHAHFATLTMNEHGVAHHAH